MSPEQQAARDAAIEEAALAALAATELPPQFNTKDRWVAEIGDRCANAILALRTTPPPAAPGEITQEQARALEAALRDTLSALLTRMAEDQGIPWVARHTVPAHPTSTIGRARAALTGVPAR